MKKLLSKILISVAMLGIFMMPLSASIKFNDNKELVLQKINLTSSAQEKPRWWLVYSVPVIGLQIEGFDDEQSCTDKQNEEKGKGNTIGQECKLGVKPVYNLGGQQITETDLDFGCSADPRTYHRCFIKVIYKLVWEPLAGLARLAAEFLDFFIYYSTNSEAYKNGFINSAWATVRDVANLFFILGLLYVAIKTILGLNVSDNKKIIGGIIIIALVINFSLFATRIVIDSGNVLAKIFYNQITPQDSNGNPIDPGDGRNKSVTVGIVSIINPQNILGQENITKNFGQFVIVLFITLAMIIYLIFMFFSLAMMFVARIASLWIAMIFSPIAFITYALHINIPSLGFKEWSKNLIGNVFMAPIFIFFLYIILLLGRSLQSITYSAAVGEDAILSRTMSSVVPLLIIFVLLREAKKMTVKYAGEMGEVFSKAPMVAGLALGATAAGSAMLLRNSAGRFAAAQSRTDKAKDYSKKRLEFDNDKTYAGKTWKEYQDDKGLKYNTWQSLGGKVNYSRAKLNEITHARDELKEYQKKAGLEGLAQYQLSGDDKLKIEKKFASEKKSDFETMVRRGKDASGGGVDLYDSNGVIKDGNNNEVRGKAAWELHEKAVNSATYAPLTPQDAQRVLDKKFEEVLKVSTEQLTTKKFKHLEHEAKEDISVGKRLYAGSTSGSYDARQIGPKFSMKDNLLKTGLLVGLTAAVATGIRSGMKTAGANPGAGKGDFMTDMGAIIATALKGAKIKVESGEASHDDHGKGLDGHGGGGHH